MTTVDDDRQQLLEGQAAARRLKAAQTAEVLANIRNRAVRRFFGEEGIPDHLKKGWAVLDQLRAHRQQVGYPLPPGGCLLLGRESVVAGAMAEMHSALAMLLHVSVDNIKLKLMRTEQGHLQPVADVQLPEGWLLPAAKDPRKDLDAAARDYIETCVQHLSKIFRKTVSERLGHCESRRPALDQPVGP